MTDGASHAYGLEGRSVIVTGGATLIGQGVVRAFAEAGGKVTVADIDTDGGGRLASDLGDGVVFAETDVRSDDACRRCAEQAAERHGGIDCLINLHATYVDDGLDSTREDWLTAFDVNVVGGVMMLKAVLPFLKHSEHAAVLCSDAASAMTGADVAVDGGYSAMGPEQAKPAIPLLMKDEGG